MSADRLFLWVRSKALFYRLTLFTRIMLAAGFIPTGMVKLLGQRFTTMPPTTPIGAFFEAMYQTGLFWRFIGAVQVVAGVLLLVPRVAHLGALMFLPVIVSIVVITVALEDAARPSCATARCLGASRLRRVGRSDADFLRVHAQFPADLNRPLGSPAWRRGWRGRASTL